MAHKCFISYKTEDKEYKEHIQNHLDIDMIDKSLDHIINSYDQDYVMRKIREDYLSDSTVTIFLIGGYSAENLGEYEQEYIIKELQASLYNGIGNTRSGILGVVLPTVEANIFKGLYTCPKCGQNHNWVAMDKNTVINELWFNYYIPHDKCVHSEDDRYCVLVKWSEFCVNPNSFIDKAFNKRTEPIADRVRVYCRNV